MKFKKITKIKNNTTLCSRSVYSVDFWGFCPFQFFIVPIYPVITKNISESTCGKSIFLPTLAVPAFRLFELCFLGYALPQFVVIFVLVLNPLSQERGGGRGGCCKHPLSDFPSCRFCNCIFAEIAIRSIYPPFIQIPMYL